MLYQPVGVSKPVRIQGSLVGQEEVDRVVRFIKENNQSDYDDEVLREIESLSAKEDEEGNLSTDNSEES